MVEDYLRQSALAHLSLAAIARPERSDEEGVALKECPFRTVITLRGQAGEPAFVTAVERNFGLRLPLRVGEVSGNPKGREILCLGPDEWWLTDAAEEAEEVVRSLEEATAELFALVVDTSDNWFALEVSGPSARDLLAKGCPLDLHPRNFGPGRCAQSLLSKAPMTLQQLDETPTFRLYVRRSFADYTWRWLSDAGREYGVAVLQS